MRFTTKKNTFSFIVIQVLLRLYFMKIISFEVIIIYVQVTKSNVTSVIKHMPFRKVHNNIVLLKNLICYKLT